MRRCAVLLLVLSAMLWQSLAMARGGSTVFVPAERAHAALHWNDAGHHHHEDGSYHLDESKESAQHVLSDHAGTSVALLICAAHRFAALGSAAPGARHDERVPSPTLDGLLRPPRPQA